MLKIEIKDQGLRQDVLRLIQLPTEKMDLTIQAETLRTRPSTFGWSNTVIDKHKLCPEQERSPAKTKAVLFPQRASTLCFCLSRKEKLFAMNHKHVLMTQLNASWSCEIVSTLKKYIFERSYLKCSHAVLVKAFLKYKTFLLQLENFSRSFLPAAVVIWL